MHKLFMYSRKMQHFFTRENSKISGLKLTAENRREDRCSLTKSIESLVSQLKYVSDHSTINSKNICFQATDPNYDTFYNSV